MYGFDPWKLVARTSSGTGDSEHKIVFSKSSSSSEETSCGWYASDSSCDDDSFSREDKYKLGAAVDEDFMGELMKAYGSGGGTSASTEKPFRKVTRASGEFKHPVSAKLPDSVLAQPPDPPLDFGDIMFADDDDSLL